MSTSLDERAVVGIIGHVPLSNTGLNHVGVVFAWDMRTRGRGRSGGAHGRDRVLHTRVGAGRLLLKRHIGLVRGVQGDVTACGSGTMDLLMGTEALINVILLVASEQ